MRNLNAIVFLLILTGLLSCQPARKKEGVFNLLPQPQEFTILGTSNLGYDNVKTSYTAPGTEMPVAHSLLGETRPTGKESNADIIFKIDESMDLKAEGYILEISKNQIQISAKDKAGLLYAIMSLNQLMEDAKEQNVYLPLCKIVDYPALLYRAIHLDVKHHLDKTEYYYKLVDKLASYKINAIIVELEDKIKYKSHPLIGSGDALSTAEWRELSEYARSRNIEISPLVQGLGHASFILKHEEYKPLRDDPESDWAFNPLDPKTYEVQFDLYKEAIEATPHGRFLHVGGDEVHTTGRGSGKTALELQLTWLNKVCKYAEGQGRTPIFWDDMPLKHAGVYRPMFNKDMTAEEVDKIWGENEHKLLDFLDEFPKNCIYMRWNYSASETAGNKKTMDWFRKHGFKVMGATAGQTRWVLMPQQESNIDNIKSFAENSIKSGLDALLLTLWDDDSPHFELYNRGIIAFAEYTWRGVHRTKEEIKSAYRQREFSYTLAPEEFAFIDELEIPVAFWKNALLKGNSRNNLKKMGEAAKESLIELPNTENKGWWANENPDRIEQAESVVETCEKIATKISAMKKQAARNNYTLEVYEQVNNVVLFTANTLLKLKALDSSQNKQEENTALEEVKKLPREFAALRKEFAAVYAQTRILEKPEGYILDQDHHHHLANQTISFDWQFYAEMLLMDKIKNEY